MSGFACKKNIRFRLVPDIDKGVIEVKILRRIGSGPKITWIALCGSYQLWHIKSSSSWYGMGLTGTSPASYVIVKVVATETPDEFYADEVESEEAGKASRAVRKRFIVRLMDLSDAEMQK
jgi:hypothetical protein